MKKYLKDRIETIKLNCIDRFRKEDFQRNKFPYLLTLKKELF